MNKVIQDGHDMLDADIFYTPTRIIPAIELVTMKFATKAPSTAAMFRASADHQGKRRRILFPRRSLLITRA